MTPNQAPRCSPALAVDRTRLLLGCYRKGECEDPDVYVTAVVSVLVHFPEDVARTVTDPVQGLPGRQKWLPTVAEVKAACDAAMRPRLDRLAREKRERDSRRLLAAPPPPSPEERDRMVARWENEVRPLLQGNTLGETRETPGEALDRLRAEAARPVVIGEGLAKRMGQP